MPRKRTGCIYTEIQRNTGKSNNGGACISPDISEASDGDITGGSAMSERYLITGSGIVSVPRTIGTLKRG